MKFPEGVPWSLRKSQPAGQEDQGSPKQPGLVRPKLLDVSLVILAFTLALRWAALGFSQRIYFQ